MKDGIYKVTFETKLGAGTGVIVISGNSVKGGDSSMYYTGTLEKTDNTATIKVHVQKHSDVQGMSSVLGLDKADLILNGATTETTAIVSGQVFGVPGVSFNAHLNFLE